MQNIHFRLPSANVRKRGVLNRELKHEMFLSRATDVTNVFCWTRYSEVNVFCMLASRHAKCLIPVSLPSAGSCPGMENVILRFSFRELEYMLLQFLLTELMLMFLSLTYGFTHSWINCYCFKNAPCALWNFLSLEQRMLLHLSLL